MSEWQPISTASVGDVILVWNGRSVLQSSWDAEDEMWVCNCGAPVRPDPTHWMPLPAPPVSP